jgi:multiple sugar transport system permease protein
MKARLSSVHKLSRAEERMAWLFITPVMLLLFGFLLIPLSVSLFMSFTAWNITTLPRFIEFGNFQELFADAVFIKSIGNTLFMMIGIPAGMACSFFLAVALKRNMPAAGFFKALYYLPAVTNGVAVALIWKWMFNQEFGMINKFLAVFGVKNPPDWLNNPATVKPALMLMGVWGGLGSTMLLFLAGLNNIDTSLYEAADMDGAGKFTTLMKITVPLISPVTFYILVVGIIGGLQMFGQVYVMLPGGGVEYSAITMVYYIWDAGIGSALPRMGFASAAAWILAVFIFIVTAVQFAVQKYWVKEAQT